MVTEPSRERIAAALALAESADMFSEFCLRDLRAKGMGAVAEAVRAYRATAPKPLRTEAEICADIGRLVRCSLRLGQVLMTAEDRARLEDLANEEPAAATAPVESATGNPLVRIQWQCSSCGWGFFGPLQDECPGCSAIHYWSGSVAPDCKPWPGYPCAPAPGVAVAPLAGLTAEPDPLHPTGRCTCGGEGRCDWCKAHPDPEDCPECAGSRNRLRDVYHMTLTYGGDPQAALQAIRKVTAPGAQ